MKTALMSVSDFTL